MVLLNTLFFPANFTVSRIPFSPFNPPRRKGVKWGKKSGFLFDFSGCRSGVVRMFKRGEGEWDQALLEVELLEFMKNSKNPDMFPSKSELLQSGRLDLAEAIEKGGGWMSMGWDDDDEGHKVDIEDGLVRNWESDFDQNGYEVAESRGGSEVENCDPKGISFMGNSSPDGAASSSGQSIEMTTEDDRGIEGILNRLERRRSLSFDLSVEKNGTTNHVYVNANKDGRSAGMPKDGENSGHAGELMVDTTDIKERLDKTVDLAYPVDEINLSDVKTRLQHLEIELSSAMRSLRSNTTGLSEKVVHTTTTTTTPPGISRITTGLSEKAKESMSEDLRQLSDAVEFQENETMNAQKNLRSVRSKLAILEGKMVLAINDAQKVLDEKQTRIDNASRALEHLHSASIVWANSGSEVLLVGSFDGWATQRKMEKSSSGIFTLSLKLYPGQYEIKFIVDGEWKVDPLRPIVNNGGFENNLLIVT